MSEQRAADPAREVPAADADAADVDAAAALATNDDLPEESGADPDQPADGASARVPRSRRVTPAVAAVALAVAVGVVLVTLAALAAAGARGSATDRDRALSAATSVVEDFISIDAGNAPDNIARMEGQATDPFRAELASFSEVFGAILSEGEVRASGGVDLAGIERIDGESATVIVGASTTVRNVQIPDGEPRNFRLVIGLRQEADRWLVASVEVAP